MLYTAELKLPTDSVDSAALTAAAAAVACLLLFLTLLCLLAVFHLRSLHSFIHSVRPRLLPCQLRLVYLGGGRRLSLFVFLRHLSGLSLPA